ncbi:ABM domain-containing protein [Durusdinium trenchii]|uniref:ABM domain-containing protein n=1 Tax=Durusdinium trenchii TaxID=1381693 RepID=A0ABP0LFC3_9DINO
MAMSRSKVALVHLGKVIRISERVIPPLKEVKVREAMSSVESEIKGWPGLMNIETLIDTQEANRFVVVTEPLRLDLQDKGGMRVATLRGMAKLTSRCTTKQWESRKHLRHWLKSDLHSRVVDTLNQVLDEPATYRELMHHEDDVFLL